jgi:hypothetical protein
VILLLVTGPRATEALQNTDERSEPSAAAVGDMYNLVIIGYSEVLAPVILAK